jgi:hypothetical protein
MHNDELAHFTIEKYLGVPATANHPSYSLLLSAARNSRAARHDTATTTKNKKTNS